MTLPESCRVAIVGGGPAGSALAALLARAGLAPVLLEKDHFPRAKVCGEFLSMESQSLLRRLGCLDAVLAKRPAVIERARFFSASGRLVEFPLGAEALGLSRFAFDELLFRHAAAQGAAVFEGAQVLKIEPGPSGRRLSLLRSLGGVVTANQLRADVVVMAGGRPSVPSSREEGPLFVGFKRHHRFVSEAAAAASGLRGCVELHLFAGGYCGVSEVEGGNVNVCLLAEQRWLASLPSPRWDKLVFELARRSPSLAGRLSALEPAGSPVSVARISLESSSRALVPSDPHVGDAAGMIAPLCGDGQAMALESALLLSELLPRVPLAELPAAWAATWRRRFAPRLRLGRALQRLLLAPRFAETAAAVLTLCPSLSRPLLAATRSSKTS